MSDQITPLMDITIPTIGVDAGPGWAGTLNEAFAKVDAHDHTSGKGAQVTPAGLNIASQLTFNGFAVVGASDVGFGSTSSFRTFPPCTLFSTTHDLWYVDGNLNKIELTNSYQPYTFSTFLGGGFPVTAFGSLVLMSSDPYGLVLTNSSSGTMTVTLPTATRNLGRLYTIKDTGHAATHTVTVATYGSETIDGSATATLTANYQVLRLYSDGIGWDVL